MKTILIIGIGAGKRGVPKEDQAILTNILKECGAKSVFKSFGKATSSDIVPYDPEFHTYYPHERWGFLYSIPDGLSDHVIGVITDLTHAREVNEIVKITMNPKWRRLK